jgi:glycosyltransferase involved in cell wall biosynthesis
MNHQPLPITAIVLTYNEERNLPDCLASLAGWVGEIFVVDSGSDDATPAIAGQHGARIVQHPFETHSRQWTWALAHLPLRHEWVLGLDADQRVTPELRAELARLFQGAPGRLDGLDGLYVKRRQVFRGRWIKHGAYYPKYLLKLFRRDKVQFDERDLMDHHFYVAGPTAKLSEDIVEDNRKEDEIAFWVAKHNRYAPLHAREELLRRREADAWPIHPSLFGSPDQRVIWLKQRWYHLPLFARPFVYFVYRYFFRLGFLDGKQGFIFHFLQGFWYRLLVDIHLDEMLKAGR